MPGIWYLSIVNQSLCISFRFLPWQAAPSSTAAQPSPHKKTKENSLPPPTLLKTSSPAYSYP
jgi:hypothetical protein